MYGTFSNTSIFTLTVQVDIKVLIFRTTKLKRLAVCCNVSLSRRRADGQILDSDINRFSIREIWSADKLHVHTKCGALHTRECS